MASNPWIVANGVTLENFWLLITQTDFLIFFKNIGDRHGLRGHRSPW